MRKVISLHFVSHCTFPRGLSQSRLAKTNWVDFLGTLNVSHSVRARYRDIKKTEWLLLASLLSALWHFDAAEWAVAVGTEITLRPPHRTRRALLTHRAPTLDGDEEPLLRPRMQDAWEWQVSISDRLHSGPR